MPIGSCNTLQINCCGPLRLRWCPHIRNKSKVCLGFGKDLVHLKAPTCPRGNRGRPNNQRYSVMPCPLFVRSILERPILDRDEIKMAFLTKLTHAQEYAANTEQVAAALLSPPADWIWQWHNGDPCKKQNPGAQSVVAQAETLNPPFTLFPRNMLWSSRMNKRKGTQTQNHAHASKMLFTEFSTENALRSQKSGCCG